MMSRVSDFLTKNANLKKYLFIFFFFWGGGKGVDGRTDEHA